MKPWLLLVGLALSGCMPLVRQPDCQTTASTPLVSTLNWKPSWEFTDVDISPEGHFYFSPVVPQTPASADAITGDMILKVSTIGSIERIRTGPKIIPEQAGMIPEQPDIPMATPGYLAATTGGLWISDIKRQQLRFLQASHLLKPETLVSTASTELSGFQPGLFVFTDAQEQLYGRYGCDLYRLGHKPYERLYRDAADRPYNCKPSDLLETVVGPGESFYDLVSTVEPERSAEKLMYQIYRFRQGKAEGWAGGPDPGFRDGTGQAARFNQPVSLAVSRNGSLYVADSQNHAIRKISPKGEVTTLAGNGSPGRADGLADQARFDTPNEVLLGPCHRLYVFDKNGIRVIALPPGPDSERWGPAQSSPSASPAATPASTSGATS